MRDVREEGLLAAARAFDLRRHVVERPAHLRDLGRAGDGHARAVVALGEAPRRPGELAQRPRDRAREKAGDDQREPGRDNTRHDQRGQQDAQCIGERGARSGDDDHRRVQRRRIRPERGLHEDPLVLFIRERAEGARARRRQGLARERVLAVDQDAAVVRKDEEARVRGARLLGERVDDIARLLAAPERRGHRGEQGSGELLEPQLQHLVLVADQERGDRDRRGEQADDDDGEV